MSYKFRQTKIVNSPRCLIAYFDILGYRKMVQNIKKADVCLNAIDSSISGWIKKKGNSGSVIIDEVSVSMISDSFIVALDLTKGKSLPNGKLSKKDIERTRVLMFLSLVSYLVQDLSLAIGHFFRGAIVCGKYYQNRFKSINTSNFIFSEGLCSAHDLGEEIADVPRIILDDSVLKLFSAKKLSVNYALQDRDGLYYLNIYQRLLYSNSARDVARILRGFFGLLKKALDKHEFRKKRNDHKIKEYRRIRRKCAWFANYHDEMIDQIIQRKHNAVLKKWKISENKGN
jgi:hypothetical protein